MRHLIAATAATILLTGCGAIGSLPIASKPSPTAQPTPTTFNIVGTLSVEASPLGSEGALGGDCITDPNGGFSDIESGGQITITNESGKIVALGTLDVGHTLESMPEGSPDGPLSATRCTFGFSVPSVPEGQNFYAIQMGHRTPLKYTRAELATPLSLTLG